MNKILVAVILIVSFSGIASIFWHNEYVYSLPTPIPEKYAPVQPGDSLHLNNTIPMQKNKPVFLHFFNPKCPCSKFNIAHFKSLVKKYGELLDFSIVVLSKDAHYSPRDIQEKFELNIPVFFDHSIADACGVYSTPQAVIIYNDKLYYRGNYNKSRYCTDKNTNYAEMAIDSLLHNNAKPVFNQYALTAYGCTLPTCTK
jgi:hypothetical protein